MIQITISKKTRGEYIKPSNAPLGVLDCWYWCCKEFGLPGKRWTWDTKRTFNFREEKDAMIFALRWS